MDLTGLTDAELDALAQDVENEQTRRRDLLTIPVQVDGMNRRYLIASGTVQGTEWVAPTGAHDAYPLDWVVVHNTLTWRSLVAANVWEPGVSGWAQEVPEGAVPAWVQPTGAHDAYALGDRVMHTGLMWESSVAANTWEPGVYGWTEIPQ